MSHSKMDERGGHKPNEITWGDETEWALNGKRWAKRFTRREARRESTRIVSSAVRAFYLDIEEERHEQALLEDDYEVDTGEARAQPFDHEEDWLFDSFPAPRMGREGPSASGLGPPTSEGWTRLLDLSAQAAIEGKADA